MNPAPETGSPPSEAAGAMATLRQLIAGVIVLGLRLALARLPVLGVLGQLPRDVLFAIGVSEVIVPALIVVILHLAWRGTLAMQPNRARPQRWSVVGIYRVSRMRHVGFTA